MSTPSKANDTQARERNPSTERTSDSATTRSPADRDIFGDEGATQPTKDKEGEPRQRSSDAGGVD